MRPSTNLLSRIRVFSRREPRYAGPETAAHMFPLGRHPPMPRIDPAFGIAIRAARHAADLSQQRLAELSRVSVRHLIAIEAGGNFSVAVLLALARELPDLDLAALLERARH